MTYSLFTIGRNSAYFVAMFGVKRLSARVLGLRSGIRPQFTSFPRVPARCYASKSSSDNKINLKGFITVGIFASIILTQVVDAVLKEKPRPRSMSEAEYYRQQQRLKRKVARFTDAHKQVYLLKSDKPLSADDVKLDNVTVIDPKELVQAEKDDDTSKFHALLNDPELRDIPRGVVIDLILKYLESHPDGKYLVLNFPTDIKESTQFEDKVVTVKKLISLNAQGIDDLVKYYKTVDKVKDISSISELKTVFE